MLCRTLWNVSQQLHQWSGSLSWDVKNSLTDIHWDIQFRGLQRAFVHKSHFYAASSQECLDIWALWIPKWRSHPDLDIFQVHGILFSWLAEISVKRSGCWEFVWINLLLSCFSFFTLNSIALPWGSPSRAGGDKKLQMTGGGKEGAPPHHHSVQCKVYITFCAHQAAIIWLFSKEGCTILLRAPASSVQSIERLDPKQGAQAEKKDNCTKGTKERLLFWCLP